MGYFQLNFSQEFQENKHNFFLVDMNYQDQGVINISPSGASTGQKLLFDRDGKYQLLVILDFSNTNIQLTLSHGPQALDKEVIECSIRLDTTLAEFESTGGQSGFISTLSTGMGIDTSFIEITDVREGSVIIDYNIQTDANQLFTLEELKDKQKAAFESGSLNFGTEVLDFTQGGDSIISKLEVVEVKVASSEPWYKN